MDNIQYIEISKLHPFPDTPFKVVENDDFNALAESVREFGYLLQLSYASAQRANTRLYQVIDE